MREDEHRDISSANGKQYRTTLFPLDSFRFIREAPRDHSLEFRLSLFPSRHSTATPLSIRFFIVFL